MIDPEIERNPLRKMRSRTVPQPAEDIGPALRQARERKGQTVDQVCQHTRIPRKLIDALEKGHFEEFAALTYLRSFLKTYCDYLELDFESLWKQAFPEPVPSPAPAAPERKEEEDAQMSVPWAGLGAAVAAVLLGLWLSNRPGAASRGDAAPPAPPQALQPIYSPPEPQLAVRFSRQAWVRIRLDGETAFEGLAPAGTRQEWKAKKAIGIKTSDLEALALTLNGAPIEAPAADASGERRIETQ